MRAFACDAHAMLRRHQDARCAEELLVPLADASTVRFAGAEWRCSAKASLVPNRQGAVDLDLSFTAESGHAEAIGVGLAIAFGQWSPRDYVLLPSAIYQGNDFAVSGLAYPPLWRDPRDFRADMPTTITDLPRLGAGSTRIEQTTGDLSTPCIGLHSWERGQGFLLLTTQQTRLGNSGLTVETCGAGGGCRFLVTAPCVRERRQDHCKAVPSDDRGAVWKAGDTLAIRLRLCFFPSPELQSLFDMFCLLRKDLNPSVRHEELPFSAAWAMVEEKYHRENWDERHGYFKMAPTSHTTFSTSADPLCFLWQLGWVGGGIATLPMLFRGNPLSSRRAWRNLEMIYERTQAPSGFFYGIGDGERFYGDGFDQPSPHGIHMVRKSADLLYYSMKHFDLIEKLGREVPPSWKSAIRRLADAFAELWRRESQFGQYVDVETGALLVGGSCAGAIAPAGLAMAGAYYGEPAYLRTAEAAARRYCHDYVRCGLTTGGPGEILSAPDSESAFAMLESLVKLHELTGTPSWRDAALEMTRQAATWVVSYDYRFPPQSQLGLCGARTTGAVWANVQNKHGAPGICTLSGEALFRLWRASGDALALELIMDIAHGIPQYLSRPDRRLGEAMRPGWMCERVNLSDWEGAKGVGGQLFGSCWPEVSLMLTAMEIPGLYVQPDTGFFRVFDHVIAERDDAPRGTLRLKLTNPTAYDAEVRVLCEDAAACRHPLGLNALLDASVIRVGAGQSVAVDFP